MIEVDSDFVRRWILLQILVSYSKSELSTHKVATSVVMPGGDLDAANGPAAHTGSPVCGDLLKDWFDCCEVDTRVALYIVVESIADTIDSSEVIVSDEERFLDGTSDKSPRLILCGERVVVDET